RAAPAMYRFANKVGRRRMSSASKSRAAGVSPAISKGSGRSRSDGGIDVGYGGRTQKAGNSGMLAALRRVVATIPRGKVATYGGVAAAAGYPGAARQVAWGLHNNSAGLPWHRVLGAGGRIRLPGSPGMEQRLRLEQEGG